MKKGTCFAYTVENGIYINLTNRCSNACSFCIRNNGDGAYGSASLWLSYEPTPDEVLAAVSSLYSPSTAEFVFCGYGEPSERLSDMLRIARELKSRYPKIPIRVNTNGHSDLINCRDTSEDYGVFDKVSVSLNAPSEEKYEQLCRSIYKGRAHKSMLDFANNVNKRFKNVAFSVVKEMLSAQEVEQCIEISKSLGIPLRIRNYISE